MGNAFNLHLHYAWVFLLYISDSIFRLIFHHCITFTVVKKEEGSSLFLPFYLLVWFDSKTHQDTWQVKSQSYHECVCRWPGVTHTHRALLSVWQSFYESGTSISPLLTASITSWGCWPSIVHPTLCAVPRISLTVPDNWRAILRGLIVRAMLITSSNVISPLCFTVIEMRTNHVVNAEGLCEVK